MKKPTIAKVCFDLQWGFVVVILFFSTIAFGGIYPQAIYVIYLLVVLSLFLQVALFFSESDYFRDFPRTVYLPGLMFTTFLVLVCIQYFFGPRVLENSSIGTVSTYATRNSFIQLVVYFLFFMICVKVTSKRESVEKLGSLITVLVFLVTILGLVQRLVGNDRILWKSYTAAPDAFFGPFRNENHFGGFLGLTFPLALGLVRYRFEHIQREQALETQKTAFWMNWASLMNTGVVFLFFLIILTLAACFFSLARVPSIILLFCCAVYFVLYGMSRHSVKFYLTLLVIFVCSFLLLQWLGYGIVTHNFQMESLQSSLGLRLDVAKQSFSLFYAFPFFGTGLGTYSFISSKVVSRLINEVSWNQAHNDYVELLTDTGIVGFCLFMGTIVLAVSLGIIQSRKNPSHWSRTMTSQALISIFCIGVMEFFDYHLKIPSIALLFVLQLALLLQCSHFKLDEKSRPPAIGSKFRQVMFKWLLPFVCLAVCVFLALYSTVRYRAYQLSQASSDRLQNLFKSTQIEPSNAEFWYQLGVEYDMESKDSRNEKQKPMLKQATISALRKAAALSPTSARYWYYLGVLEYSSGYEQNGIGSLEKSVYWAPARLKYSLYLLTVYLRESQKAGSAEGKLVFLSKAKSLYNRLQRLEVRPNPSDYQHWMGDYYYERLQQLTPHWTPS